MTAIGGALALSGALAATAAAQGTNPSSATPVAAGVPMSGTWTGTPRPSWSDKYVFHWYKPTFALRPGDVAQVAVDLTGTPPTGTLDAYTQFCFVPPVDDFAAQDTLIQHCGQSEFASSPPNNFRGGELHRFTMPYDFPQANGFFVVRVRYDFQAPAGTYAFTVESVTTRVNIGAIAPRKIKRSFTFRASARYGDNTAAGDGISGVLQWKRARRGGLGPASFKTLTRATTAGGGLAFRASLPKQTAARLARAKSSVQLRACVNQPGSTTTRCTPVFTTRVVR